MAAWSSPTTKAIQHRALFYFIKILIELSKVLPHRNSTSSLAKYALIA